MPAMLGDDLRENRGLSRLVKKISNSDLRHRSRSRTKSIDLMMVSIGAGITSVGVGQPIKVPDEASRVVSALLMKLEENLPKSTNRGTQPRLSPVPDWTTSRFSNCNPNADQTIAQRARVGPNPTVVNINILFPDGTKLPRIAKADTGADENFISFECVRRSNMANEMRPLEPGEVNSWIGAADSCVSAHGKLRVIWSVPNGVKTYDTWFFVVESRSFDIILGADFLLESGYMVVNQRALLILQENGKSNMSTAESASKEEKKRENDRLKQEETKRRKDQAVAAAASKGKSAAKS